MTKSNQGVEVCWFAKESFSRLCKQKMGKWKTGVAEAKRKCTERRGPKTGWMNKKHCGIQNKFLNVRVHIPRPTRHCLHSVRPLGRRVDPKLFSLYGDEDHAKLGFPRNDSSTRLLVQELQRLQLKWLECTKAWKYGLWNLRVRPWSREPWTRGRRQFLGTNVARVSPVPPRCLSGHVVRRKIQK